MKQTLETGMNKTGTQLSPRLTKQMVEGVEKLPSEIRMGTLSYIEGRQMYIRETGNIGSIPLPATMAGALKTVADRVAGENVAFYFDKLGERLAFERTGARLYDAIIAKCEMEGTMYDLLDDLEQIRLEEVQHFELLRDTMTALGGDPTAQTPCADVTGVESMGLIQVVTDPRTTLLQSLHSILIAELADVDGWRLLIAVADRLGQDEARKFEIAHQEEEEHLATIRRWVNQLSMAEAKS